MGENDKRYRALKLPPRRLGDKDTENLENIKNKKNINYTESAENKKNINYTENTENPQNPEKPKNPENPQNPQNPKNTENIENIENIENLENIENTEQMPHGNASREGESPVNGSSFQDEMYYEIEYDATPMSGVEEFVQKTQKLPAPERDEVGELFARMRDIARRNRVLVFGNSRFYNKRAKQESSAVFYKQGMFMKDFVDDYEESVPYTDYYPCYQMMGYRQLRTYFTWRAKIRKGKVEEASLSYAYLYIYELLNNIGVESPQDGLDRLLAFWKEFRVCQSAVDKYMPQWLKDYYIYYGLPMAFSEFVSECGLEEQYPEMTDSGRKFELFCSISKYDIRKSVFYGNGRETFVRDCFNFTFDRLVKVFAEQSMDFESMIFLQAKSMAVWMPFKEALFHPWREQYDRQVTISAREVYMCSGNQWTYRTAIATESGSQLMGYVFKQMESDLRRTVNYKYKITVGMGSLSPATIKLLEDAKISLEQCISDAVKEFYREATRTIVTVDRGRLEKIRREAMLTQEKLFVPEDEEIGLVRTGKMQPVPEPGGMSLPRKQGKQLVPEDEEIGLVRIAKMQSTPEDGELALDQDQMGQVSLADPTGKDLQRKESSFAEESREPWSELRLELTETELEALRLILRGDADIKQFADSHGVMLEVLADGINEKAADTVGDSLLDDEFMIYDDYFEMVKEMLET